MFTVTLIAPDLRHEETIVQAAYALNTLQKTIDHVFQHLDKRIAGNSEKVQELSKRIKSADQRIRSLVGSKKAVQIFAPARYPATHVLSNSKVTFGRPSLIEPASDNYDIKSSFESIHPDSRHDKLVFFHSNSTNNISALKGGALPEHITAARIKLNSLGQTLGAPPENLRSLASLLRFNSEEEAYNRQMANEQGVVSWRRSKLPKNEQKSKQKRIIEPAPHSLAHRNQRAQPAGDLRYMPKMSEAPIIDLPLDLPSLEGVAQDIHFVGFANMQTKIIRDVETVSNVESELSSEVLKTTTKIKDISKPKTITTSTPSTSPPAPPPPPPPPPPPSAPVLPQVEEVQKAAPIAASDTRSALMDAIRKAGGARGGGLRAAAAAPVDVTDNMKPAAASSGNLMEDLHNKLMMRRKGISGSSNIMSSGTNNVGAGNPVLQRLSALIPAAPQREQQHSDADDDDWD